MEVWGSSYLVHDVQAVRLVGTIGSSTPQSQVGSVRLSFHREPGILSTTRNDVTTEIVAKWEVAINLIALIQVLLLQNKLLRGETASGRLDTPGATIFTVSGGARGTPVTLSWDSTREDVRCNRVQGGSSEHFELVLEERAAAELVAALVERIAANGIAMGQTAADTRRTT